MTRYPAILPPLLIEEAVKAALLEDFGRAGDITSNATIPPETMAQVVLNAREEGVVCGMDFAAASFAMQKAGLLFTPMLENGARIHSGDILAKVSGNARALLSGERVALNYLCHLSGIASYTAKFADIIAHTKAQICCTRKTTPGLRAFEKYAVRCGGGSNHRFGLDDAILIKDNHIAICGGVAEAIKTSRAYAGHLVAIEVEVDTLEQFEEALSVGVEAVLLDNMPPAVLKEAVSMNKGRAKLEASGGIAIDTVKAVAESGVDYISTSKITMAAGTLDIGLDIDLSV